MYLILGYIYFVMEIYFVYRAFRSPNVISIFIATISLFSVGYFQLPLFFRGMTSLRGVNNVSLFEVSGMELMFFVCVVLGLKVVGARERAIPGVNFRPLDSILLKNWWPTTIVAGALYIIYIYTTNLTSYSSADFNAYFEERSPISGVVGFFAGLSLSALALNLVLAFRRKHWLSFGIVAILFAIIELRLLQGGQRFLFTEPLFVIFVCFVGLGQYRTASMAIVAGIAALVLVSPFAVALREARASDATRQTHEANFSYGENPLETLLQSILDRADLIYVSSHMKDYIDQHGYAGAKFYTSVLAIPIPRILYPDKPVPLSDTGDIHGEASVLAWHVVVDNQIGSLTQFGAIVAYREGGWIAVILDGFAAGLLFGVALTMFSRGGYIAHLFLPIAFVNWSVRKVPPSFFEALADVMTYLPVVLGLFLLSIALSRRRRAAPVAPGRVLAGTIPRPPR